MIEAPKLSVFIITMNEERHLANCLVRAKQVADEVIVLDSGSTDKTREIAEEQGAQFHHRDFDGFGQQKYAAEQLCANDWVLNLDADEYLTSEAVDEIKAFLASSELQKYDGARLKTPTTYPGKSNPRPFADYHYYIRLYDKRVLNYPLHPTHDAIDVASDERIFHLKHAANHHSFESVEALDQKARQRTRFYFSKEKRKPLAANLIRSVIEYPVSFFKCYILRRHCTAGFDGVRVAHIYAKYRFIRILQQVLRRELV